jgi:hypothetical protein
MHAPSQTQNHLPVSGQGCLPLVAGLSFQRIPWSYVAATTHQLASWVNARGPGNKTSALVTLSSFIASLGLASVVEHCEHDEAKQDDQTHTDRPYGLTLHERERARRTSVTATTVHESRCRMYLRCARESVPSICPCSAVQRYGSCG